jgi:hypothetical protein
MGYNWTWRVERHPRMVGDVDNDGDTDLVGFGGSGVYVARSDGWGGWGPAIQEVAGLGYLDGWRVERHPRVLADTDGDGDKDIVAFGDAGVWTARAGATAFEPAAFTVAGMGYNQAWRVERNPRMVADIDNANGDDLVGFGDDGVWVSMAQGNGGYGSPYLALLGFGYNDGWRVDRHPRMLEDIDNDGDADIVAFGDSGVWVSRSNGNGTFTPATFVLAEYGYAPSAGGWSAEYPRLLGDVNGDGSADIVGFSEGNVMVSLANGSGSFYPGVPALYGFGYWDGWRVGLHTRTLHDVDGDGDKDIVGFGPDGVWSAEATGGGNFGGQSFVLKRFGNGPTAGSWTPTKHLRLLGDVDRDGFADVIGFGNEGVTVGRPFAP